MSKLVYPLRWYALVVPPQKEYVAAYLLERRFGAQCYVPTETRWRRRNRYAKRKEQQAFPVAPRYVLALLPEPVPWFLVFNLRVVSGVVGFDGAPRALNDRRVRDLVSRVPNGKLMIDRVEVRLASGKMIEKGVKHRIETVASSPAEQQFMASGREFRVGDEADIAAGPFEGHRVRVCSIVGATAKILLPLFGDEREVDVPVSALEAA